MLVVKNLTANAEDIRDMGLLPELGRSPGRSWKILFHALEEGMATHSRILAWRIPWTEEPGGLQSMGLQTVGHD